MGMNLKYWRMAFGQRLVKVLQSVVYHTGMADRFEVVSFPGEIYRISVFRLDSSGKSLFKECDRKGFEFFRIEIVSSTFLSFSLFDDSGKQKGASKPHKDTENFDTKVEEMLLYLLFPHWSKQFKSHD